MQSTPPPALLLTRRDIRALAAPADFLAAVEAGFRAAVAGRADGPPPMHLHGDGGAFHAKGATFAASRAYAALKLNGNFPQNTSRNGLPTIQGAILLADAGNGTLLAILDSGEVTRSRTAAASALAATRLAHLDASTIGICGCGEQGRAHLVALAQVLPLRRARVWDVEAETAREFARAMTPQTGVEIQTVPEPAAAAAGADVIVTCTPARSPFLRREHVAAGAFVAAVGADSPDKSELDPQLLGAATVVVDVLAQCLQMGDLRHAIEAGVMTADDVHADLGEVVVGRKPGRSHAGEIIIFDSTGTAIEDVACAAFIYEQAVRTGAGAPVALAAG